MVSAWFGGGNALSNWRPARCFVPEALSRNGSRVFSRQVVPWAKLCALIEPHYPKPGNGQRPKELERALRIDFL